MMCALTFTHKLKGNESMKKVKLQIKMHANKQYYMGKGMGKFIIAKRKFVSISIYELGQRILKIKNKKKNCYKIGLHGSITNIDLFTDLLFNKLFCLTWQNYHSLIDISLNN